MAETSRVSLVAVLMAVTASSAHAQPKSSAGAEPPAASDAPSRPHLDAPTRPTMTHVDALDYESLPLMIDGELAPASEATFEIEDIPQNPNVTPGGRTWRITLPNRSSLLRVGAEIVPWGANHGPAPPAGEAEWYVLDRSKTSSRKLALRRFAGAFDGQRAVANEAARVDARAIVPGIVYAFRRCVAGCDDPVESEARTEVVTLVAPLSVWTSSTDETARARWNADAAFTIVSAEVQAGSSATVGAIVAHDRMGGFVPVAGLRRDRMLTVALDVLRIPGEVPELTLSSASVDDAPELFAWNPGYPRKPPPSKTR